LRNKYTQLIQPVSSRLKSKQPLHWTDLGCGNGVFTEALASFLPKGSSITAIDKYAQQLPKAFANSVNIDFKKGDFEKDNLPLERIDGILMANAFHFIQEKEKLILKLEKYFHSTPAFLMVEYDQTQASQWVPFPIPFEEINKLFQKLNYRIIEKLGEQKSVYGGSMYACYFSKN
jgi:trans-aconitate methyltransferase